MPDTLTRHHWRLPAKAARARQRGLALAAFLAGAMLGAAAMALHAPATGPTAPAADHGAVPAAALTVTLVAARPQRVERRIPADGAIAAWEELRIGIETGGLRVAELLVAEGEAVRAGQLLARFEDALPAAQLAQAEAAIAEAEAARDLARADLERIRPLVATQAAARQALDQRQAELLRSEARLASLRAARLEAAARLAQTRLTAPDDGVVLTRDILLGAVGVPGQIAFTLLRQGRIELQARVPELALATIARGQRVVVLHGGRRFTGEVARIAPALAGATRLGIVHVALPPGTPLAIGMFVTAEIETGGQELAVLPAEAVSFRDGAPVVFLAGEAAGEGLLRVAMRRVALGPRTPEGLPTIAEGLAPGARVVGLGAGFLADGDLVRLSEGR